MKFDFDDMATRIACNNINFCECYEFLKISINAWLFQLLRKIRYTQIIVIHSFIDNVY